MGKFKEGMPIQVGFNGKILPHGDFSIVRITQNDQEIQLTRAQVESLVAKLQERLLKKP